MFYIRKFFFGAVKLTKNADPDKYSCSAYGIGFDANSSFSLSNSNGFGKNVTILGVDNTFSVHADNRKKDILILAKDQQVD